MDVLSFDLPSFQNLSVAEKSESRVAARRQNITPQLSDWTLALAVPFRGREIDDRGCLVLHDEGCIARDIRESHLVVGPILASGRFLNYCIVDDVCFLKPQRE